MKYLVLLCDGMADLPLERYGGRTPLQVAHTPCMDYLARHGSCGRAQTVPTGMMPGSDTANLSVLGYDPGRYYSGRSPLEAAGMGIRLENGDVSYRCNLVTLSEAERYEDARMVDYSAGEIPTQESAELIAWLRERLDFRGADLYPGIRYRHCFVRHFSSLGTDLTPPHDISGRCIGDYLPRGRYGEEFLALQKRSWELLKTAPVNLDRVRRGEKPASSLWFWGEGTKPELEPYRQKFGLTGGVVTAVDLIRGLGVCAGLTVATVEGATGNYDTNYEGKAQAAIDLWKTHDFVYVHVEAPDECGHHFDAGHKIYAIEQIDEKILSPLLAYLQTGGEDFGILLLPDHPTPVSLGTHIAAPVPYVIYSGQRELLPHAECYDEEQMETFSVVKGHDLMKILIKEA